MHLTGHVDGVKVIDAKDSQHHSFSTGALVLDSPAAGTEVRFDDVDASLPGN